MCCNILKLQKSFSWAKIEFTNLIFRRFPSINHAQCWVDYEKVLAARTILAITSKLIWDMISIISGQTMWSAAQEYLDKGGPPNAELAAEILPKAKDAYLIYLCARLICVIAYLKWPRLTKLSLYFELISHVIGMGFVREINSQQDEFFISILIFIDFLLCYFDFAPSLVACLLANMTGFVKRAVFYEEPV